MGGGNTAATSTVTSGATPGIVAPRHVQLPDIPIDNNVLFELLVFIYSALVLGLQYINLYKTVWWLPHSSAHYGLVSCISRHSFICLSWWMYFWNICSGQAGEETMVHFYPKSLVYSISLERVNTGIPSLWQLLANDDKLQLGYPFYILVAG